MLKTTRILSSALRAFFSAHKGNYKIVLVLTYHRIGEKDPDNPYHNYHTVGQEAFKKQIWLLSRLGRFVSLDEVRRASNLAPLSFVLTFDDGFSSILSVKPFLESRSIPYAISICTGLSENGIGVTDKVNFILKHLSQREIIAFTREQLGADFVGRENEFSFYNITKSDKLNSAVIETRVIDPLFNRIPRSCSLGSTWGPYLNWEQIKEHFLENDLVTVVNHGRRHLNMARLSLEEIVADIDEAESDFRIRLGIRPVYFTVPYGKIYQDMVSDLTGTLHARDYKGVLWSAGGSNAIKNPYESQIMHLSRIPAPNKSVPFAAAVVYGLSQRRYRLVDCIPREDRRRQFAIIPGEDPNKALLFENLVNQGRDYTSDPSFYNYLYGNNPYKGTSSSDYYAVETSGRIESIIYRFSLNFIIRGSIIRGSYASSWWKLPQASTWASGLLLLKLARSEAILGSYKPSHYAAQAMRKWNRVAVRTYSIAAPKGMHQGEFADQRNVKEYDAYCEDISPLTQALNERYAFTVARSAQYYRWRFDQYPLAQVRYFVLYREGRAVAYFVTHMKEQTLAVSDFYCPATDDFAALLNRLQAFCASSALRTVRIETSLVTICDYLGATYRCAPQVFHNYYYFNPRLLETNQHWRKVEKDWSNLEFHETPACGDVLLK